MFYILLLVLALALISFSIWQGYIGVHGAAVYRTENPVLFWGQVALLGVGVIVLGVAIARGDL